MPTYMESEIPTIVSTGNGNNGYGNGMWGDGAWWIVILLIFGWGAWGGNGFGGFGGGNGGALTRGELCQDMNFNDLQSGVRGLSQGICDSTFALNNTMTSGFAGVQQTLCQGFNGVNTAILTSANQTNQGICNLGYNIQSGFNGLSHQISDCCCTTQRSIDNLNFNMAKNTCDIIQSNNAVGQRIIDFLTSEKISSLQLENQGLKFQASQASQNAFIIANQEAQTAELIRRLGRDCPTPAYLVPNPNCCYNNTNFNNSCCGCN